MSDETKLTDAKIAERRQERLRQAIDDSSLLLDFIAASRKDAPTDAVKDLVAIQHAYAAKPNLSADDEAKFWLAYSKLATAILPATVDGIRYVAPNKNLGFIGWMWKNRWITGIVFVAVVLFTAYCLIRFRHRPGLKAVYEPENKRLEWGLTIATAVGVAAMLAPGLFV